jgi:uncharacterized protein YndB with AHSA1/START domain
MNTPVNPLAPVRCTRSLLMQAPPDRVWSLLTAIDDWSRWQPDIPKAQCEGPLQAGACFRWKTGGAGIRSRVHTLEPGRELGWTGRTLGTRAIHNWTLEPEGEGCRVRVEESLEGWLPRLMPRAFDRSLARGMERWLEFLKAAAEGSDRQP